MLAVRRKGYRGATNAVVGLTRHQISEYAGSLKAGKKMPAGKRVAGFLSPVPNGMPSGSIGRTDGSWTFGTRVQADKRMHASRLGARAPSKGFARAARQLTSCRSLGLMDQS